MNLLYTVFTLPSLVLQLLTIAFQDFQDGSFLAVPEDARKQNCSIVFKGSEDDDAINELTL